MGIHAQAPSLTQYQRLDHFLLLVLPPRSEERYLSRSACWELLIISSHFAEWTRHTRGTPALSGLRGPGGPGQANMYVSMCLVAFSVVTRLFRGE